ncbi:MAG: alpha/beta fold hydrolase [Pseudomonadota bacterium]
MTCHVFIHGVPDTPYMWTPLIEALGLEDHEIETPALPGFTGPVPNGFPSTKEAYADWLIRRCETIRERTGKPMHLVGHDWGAILALRIASLRPDLFETWCVSNALIDSQYAGHRMAKIWATPIAGELLMAVTRRDALAKSLAQQGLPEDMARHEAANWSPHMRRAILRLYRSARGLRFSKHWEDDLETLPDRGLVFWGETDPYVGLDVAERFRKRWGYPLEIAPGAGHWAIVERADHLASLLKSHWAGAPASSEPDL